MVTELRTNGKNSIDLLTPWRHHGTLSCRDEPALQPLDLASNDVADVPRYAASDSLLEVLLRDGPYSTSRCSKGKSQPARPLGLRKSPRIASPAASTFSFTLPDKAAKPLEFCIKPLASVWFGVKRRRNASDVDGFNTAGLSSKKRRLRSELITSRLSQPYSQPATHILNREGQESGDKRFLKMATTVDTARRIAHLHATSFLRFSLMNRVRKRLGLNIAQQDPRLKNEQGNAPVLETTAIKAGWRPPSTHTSPAAKILKPAPRLGNGMPPVAATSGRSDQAANNPKPVHPQAKAHACRLSKPAALPLPVGDVAATKKRTSPRIHPIQSPELRPSLVSLDDLEEDSFGYLHLEEDDWDDGAEDPDNVYSDFSVIFGEGSPGAEAQEDRTYEEYLDELDGLCWVTR